MKNHTPFKRSSVVSFSVLGITVLITIVLFHPFTNSHPEVSEPHRGATAIGMCRGNGLNDVSKGKFKILSVKKAQIECYSEEKEQRFFQEGPGCTVEVEKIKADGKNLNKDKFLTVYAGSEGCTWKIGSLVETQFMRKACDADIPFPLCGRISDKDRVRLRFKEWRLTGDITEFIKNRQTKLPTN